MLKTLLVISSLIFTCNTFAQTTVITNINGYTLQNAAVFKFSAIQFTDDKIDKLYRTGETIPDQAGITIVDGEGKTLLPGLIDAHGHVLSYGLSLQRVDLVGSTSEQAAVQKTIQYAQNNKSQTWIQGRGWNQVQWSNNQFPSAASLDKYFPDTPVWLNRIDGHAGWANSKAMALANITSTTQTPEGGEIIKDPNGKPTGVFIDNAMDLITNAIAPLTLKEKQHTLLTAMKSLASMGLTSVHDAGIDNSDILAYKKLSHDNLLPIRINAMLYLPSENWQETLKNGPFKSKDDMFALNSVKIQADGALGSRGASLIDDYSDHSGHKGLLLHETSILNYYIESAMNAGFQVNTHAIGDNANKLVLDIYQEKIHHTQTAALRHRIEHAQVLRLADIPRFASNSIIASIQATHATSDKNMAVDRLGDKRILGAYAWRKLLDAKAIIAAGSDFPVESPNPFFGLHSSVTRQDHDNQPENGWFFEEKMTRTEAFRSFTVDAAFAGHQENIIGSLAEGKKADFILVQDDFFTTLEQNIWQNKVLKTWVNGQLVYQAMK